MVQRVSQELQLNTKEQVQARSAQIGNVAPDFNKFGTSGVEVAASVNESTGSRILSRLVQTGSKLAQQGLQQSMTEAYLDGVAKVGTIKSEEELDGNILMRDWQVAGYRDTVGRIAAADREAQIAADMPKLREQSPEKFAEYLAENRKALMAQFEGMSIQARESTFAQQMMVERSAIRKHATEHYKFGVETEQKSIKTALDVSIAALNNAKGDASSYDAATKATFATAFSSIAANQRLPQNVKGKMIAEFATYALESDNQALYQMIQNTAVPMGDGEAPLSSLMSWEENTQLSKAFAASMKRTEAFRAADFMDRTAKFKADWDDPNTPLMPVDAVRSHLAEGIQRGLVSADQYQSLMNDYYEKSSKKQASSSLAQAYAAGDQQGMLRLGKTGQEGLEAYIETIGRKMSLPQVVDSLFTIGAQTGQGNAFRKAGELMTPAFAQIGNNDKIDPANAASISQTLARFDKLEKDGNAGAFHQFLSAFDPEVQAKITYMRDNLAKGNEPTAAIAAATVRVLEDQKLTPAVRAELAASNGKEIIAAVNELEPRSIWSTITTGVQSLWSADAANTMALTTRRQWWENEDRVNEVMAGSRLAVMEKMTEISNANPHMNIKSVRSMALADVAGRTVETEWGPLVVPKGFTPQRFFKVGNDVGTERIASALQEHIKAQPGNRVAFSIGTQGQLMFQELNEQGRPASAKRILDINSVAPMVQAQRQKQADEYRLNHGEGVTLEVGGVKVTYNGDNTANVDNAWMRRVRDDIVSQGTVRVSGIPAEVASKALMMETDAAAKQAVRLMSAAGVATNNEAAFKLFTNIAFTADTKDKPYGRLVQAIQQRNPDLARKALELTPLFSKAHQARRSYLMSTLFNALKG